jgi:hypothetical protein
VPTPACISSSDCSPAERKAARPVVNVPLSNTVLILHGPKVAAPAALAAGVALGRAYDHGCAPGGVELHEGERVAFDEAVKVTGVQHGDLNAIAWAMIAHLAHDR